MPTYDYACTECSHAFEAVQAFSDDALTQCPQCQGRLRKVFGNVGVVFKGSGFYRNDSRGADPKPSSSPTASAAGDAAKDTAKATSESSSESSAAKDTPTAAPASPSKDTKTPATAAATAAS